MRFNTSLLHAGVTKETNGSTLPPVYQTSAFEQESAADLEKIFENKAPGYCYTRVANPTITAFENRITKLEGGIASVACASGMAALMNTFLNILSSGDELISSASLYGGTIDLFHDLEAFGIITRYVENNNWQQIEDSINEHTRLIFAETIGNPCLDVTDIEKLAEIAHAHDIPLVVDNTTSTAYLIQVLKHGADIVVNSSSKYINGSSNAISGILTDSGKFKWDKNRYPGFADYVKYGPMAFVAKLRNSLFRNMGACLAPVNAYLNIIGLETLGLRMERECSNALELASWIENNYPDIKVNYPGRCSSKWHEIAKKQLTNGYGVILTIRVGSKEKAFKFIDSKCKEKIVFNICGIEQDIKYDDIMMSAKENNINVICKNKFLTEEEYEEEIYKTDVILLPYRKIFTGNSGPMTDGIYADKFILGPNNGNLGYLIKKYNLGSTFIQENYNDLAREIEKISQVEVKKTHKYKYELSIDKFNEKYTDIYNYLEKGKN